MTKNLTSQDREHYAKLAEVRRLLHTGPKTWEELAQTSTMSKPTLSKALIDLQKRGEIEHVGIIRKEGMKERSKLVYHLIESKTINVPGMIEERPESLIGVTLKKDLDIKQWLVWRLYHDVSELMHHARKIMQIKNADELSPEKKAEYADRWIASAVDYSSDAIMDTLRAINEEGKHNLEEFFGKYEDDPSDFFEQVTNFSRNYQRKYLEHEEKTERKRKSGEIKTINVRKAIELLRKEVKE